jgi:HEAT repeat protein
MVKRIEDWIELLHDGNVVARCTAARALGEMGEQARAALSCLMAALADREPVVRDAIVEALGSIAPEASDVILALRQALADTNSFVRRTAAKVLKKAGIAGAAN